MLNKLQADKRLFSFYIPIFIAVVYLFIAVASVQHDDITFDEGTHLRYGVQVLKGKADRDFENKGFRSTMPVSALNALPRGVEQFFNHGLKKTDWGKSDVKQGRYITLLFGLILLLYCFKFSVSLVSAPVACIILSFVAFDPNILAHARLVTTDIYGVTGFIATIYHLWKWLVQGKTSHFYYWCIAIAVAQCCKPNNILLYPISLLPIIFYLFKSDRPFAVKRVSWYGLIFVITQVIIINAFFLFSAPWGSSLSQLRLQSNFFQSLQQGWLSNIPIPFSKAYVDTFDLVQYERETFDGTPLNYLLGELRYKKGFWNYYLVCYALKTPVVSMLISLCGAAYAVSIKKISKTTFFFCCWPCLFVIVFLSKSSIQNGYRYLLPFTCLLLIFSGFLLEWLAQKIKTIKLFYFVAIPLFMAIVAYPDYLSYTNIFIGDKKTAYRYFADSNLNWGQRASALKKMLTEHPDYIFEPDKPSTGIIVVDLNNLVGIQSTEKFKWLRENYKPVATIANCYLVFDVKKLPM